MNVLRQLFTVERVRDRYGFVIGYYIGYGLEALWLLAMIVCVALLITH